MLSPQWLDQLRSRISLSALIGRSTRLTRAGREFKACCPFHEEKTPSFTVNDEKGFYHCFGCGAHGDAIRWMTDQRGLPFIDAVRELAAEAGMELPAPDPKAARQTEQRQGLHEVTAAAQAWFAASLQAPEGAAARGYLAGRGFPDEIVARFGFGYAPPDRQALRRALAGFPDELLVEAGLRIAVDDREPYDRFRDRLMLPIRDPRGRVIAFGGRILDAGASDAPKYLNSPDTPLFDKGRTLFNLDRAGPIARNSGRLVVVEGYMDVVALAAAGIEEAVAPLGTALTEAQIELLWRVCETPVLCFDGDPAGQRAASRAMLRVLPLLRPGYSLMLAVLPPGVDPDDMVNARGGGAMRDLIAAAQPLVDALWVEERNRQPLATPEAKAGLKARLLERSAQIANPDVRALYRRELLERFGAWAYPPRPARSFGRAPFRAAHGASVAPSQAAMAIASSPATEPVLAAAIVGFLRYPDALPTHSDTLARLRPSDRRWLPLIDLLVELGDAGAPLEPADMATILAERRLRPPARSDYADIRLSFLDERADPCRARQELGETVALLVEQASLHTALAGATARFEAELSEGAFAEQQRLRERKVAHDKRMMQRASARAGTEQEVNGRDGGH